MTDEATTTRSKVARLIDEYGLTSIGDELERRWTRADDRSSLRDLSEYFNRQLLRATLETAETNPLDGEVENLYRLLVNDDITSGVRQETRSRLKQRGVDVETLEEDFVSYQSIRTYLQTVRDATASDEPRSPEDHRRKKRNTIQRLTDRLDTVTEQSLTELENADHLTLREFDVLVTVRVHCSDCNTQVQVTDLLTEGGCQCHREAEQ